MAAMQNAADAVHASIALEEKISVDATAAERISALTKKRHVMVVKNISSKRYVLYEKVEETPKDLFLSFMPHDGNNIQFLPGMFVMIGGIDSQGKTFPKRAFSVASEPSSNNIDVLAIKEPHNRPSHFIEAEVGDVFIIEGPHGKFTIDQPNSKMLFVAGGTGYAPFRSALREILRNGSGGNADIHLLWSLKHTEEIARREELASMIKSIRGLSVTITITRSDEGTQEFQPEAWKREAGRINADMLRRDVPDAAERAAYICGSNDFGKSVEAALLSVGTPKEKIKKDIWG
jgi:ferredoxin-NADP reductase